MTKKSGVLDVKETLGAEVEADFLDEETGFWNVVIEGGFSTPAGLITIKKLGVKANSEEIAIALVMAEFAPKLKEFKPVSVRTWVGEVPIGENGIFDGKRRASGEAA